MAEVIDAIKDKVKKGEAELKEIGAGIKKISKKTKDVLEDVEENVEEGLEDAKEILKEKVHRKKGEKSEPKEPEKAEEKSPETSTEDKKKELLEKAKKLKEKLSTEKVSSEELKEQVKAKKRGEMLVPLDEYVKAGIYLGTRVVTPDMRPFVYRRRADGLAIFNTDIIDEKLKEGASYLAKFAPEDVILVCKRQAGWRAVQKFGELTGIRTFTKKYPAGILTNKQLPDFFENQLTIITDHWVDKNALNDTLKVHKKVLMICDTNNFSKGANCFIIGNNKSEKSLGLIFYLLAREYIKARGIKPAEQIPDLTWWTGEDAETAMPTKIRKRKLLKPKESNDEESGSVKAEEQKPERKKAEEEMEEAKGEETATEGK